MIQFDKNNIMGIAIGSIIMVGAIGYFTYSNIVAPNNVAPNIVAPNNGAPNIVAPNNASFNNADPSRFYIHSNHIPVGVVSTWKNIIINKKSKKDLYPLKTSECIDCIEIGNNCSFFLETENSLHICANCFHSLESHVSIAGKRRRKKISSKNKTYKKRSQFYKKYI